MEKTLSKPYQELFASARKNFDYEAMETVFNELCTEIGIPDPQTQAEIKAKEQEAEQATVKAAVELGKRIAEKHNAEEKQKADRNMMLGIKM